jgi:uncharacterized protein (TIGR00290 family)
MESRGPPQLVALSPAPVPAPLSRPSAAVVAPAPGHGLAPRPPPGPPDQGLNVIALVSGGKDSFFSLLHCLAHRHRVVAFANLHPPAPAPPSPSPPASCPNHKLALPGAEPAGCANFDASATPSGSGRRAEHHGRVALVEECGGGNGGGGGAGAVVDVGNGSHASGGGGVGCGRGAASDRPDLNTEATGPDGSPFSTTNTATPATATTATANTTGNIDNGSPSMQAKVLDLGETETDLNSFMYQTVGHQVIPLYAEATGIPLYRRAIVGGAREQGKDYCHAPQGTRGTWSPSSPGKTDNRPTNAVARSGQQRTPTDVSGPACCPVAAAKGDGAGTVATPGLDHDASTSLGPKAMLNPRTGRDQSEELKAGAYADANASASANLDENAPGSSPASGNANANGYANAGADAGTGVGGNAGPRDLPAEAHADSHGKAADPHPQHASDVSSRTDGRATQTPASALQTGPSPAGDRHRRPEAAKGAAGGDLDGDGEFNDANDADDAANADADADDIDAPDAAPLGDVQTGRLDGEENGQGGENKNGDESMKEEENKKDEENKKGDENMKEEKNKKQEENKKGDTNKKGEDDEQGQDDELGQDYKQGEVDEQGEDDGQGEGEPGDDDQDQDETESMTLLLRTIMAAHPEANAVCAGAILSTYQRTRVESVATRLGLTPLAYLWKYPVLPVPVTASSSRAAKSAAADTDGQLLLDMATAGLDARIIKVASGGLDQRHLWTNVASPAGVQSVGSAMRRFGAAVPGSGAVIGEGGEFETLVLDGPDVLFRHGRIVVDEADKTLVSEGGGAVWLKVLAARVEAKETPVQDNHAELSANGQVPGRGGDTGGGEQESRPLQGKVRVPDLLDPRFAAVAEGLKSGRDMARAGGGNGSGDELAPRLVVVDDAVVDALVDAGSSVGVDHEHSKLGSPQRSPGSITPRHSLISPHFPPRPRLGSPRSSSGSTLIYYAVVPENGAPGPAPSASFAVAAARPAVQTRETVPTTQTLESVPTLESVSALESVSTLEGVSALESVQTLDSVPTLHGIPTLESVSALDSVQTVQASESAQTLQSVQTLESAPTLDSAPTGQTLESMPALESGQNAQALESAQTLDNTPTLETVQTLESVQAREIVAPTQTLATVPPVPTLPVRSPSTTTADATATATTANGTATLTTIEAETESIVSQVRRRLDAASLPSSAVLSTTVLLRHMSDFPAVNAIYGALFSDAPNPPARVTIAVGDGFLPRGRGIAVYLAVHTAPDRDGADRQGLHVQSRSYWAPANIGPYSQAISWRVGSLTSQYASVAADAGHQDESRTQLVSIAGQIPLVPATMQLPVPSPGTADSLELSLALSLQHLWRIGADVGVQWWSSAVAYFPRSEGPSDVDGRTVTDMAGKARLAAQAWEDAHLWLPEGERGSHGDEDDDDDEDGPDLWDRTFNPMYTSFVDDTTGSGSGGASGQARLPDWDAVLGDESSSVGHKEDSQNQLTARKKANMPYFFAVEVDELPRSAPVEWHAHLGFAQLATVSCLGEEMVVPLDVPGGRGNGLVASVCHTVVGAGRGTHFVQTVIAVRSGVRVGLGLGVAGTRSAYHVLRGCDWAAARAVEKLGSGSDAGGDVDAHGDQAGETASSPLLVVQYLDVSRLVGPELDWDRRADEQPSAVVPCRSIWNARGERLLVVGVYQSVFA